MDDTSVESLLEYGIIAEDAAGAVTVGESFRDAVEARRTDLESLPVGERVASVTADAVVDSILASHEDLALLAVFDALGAAIPDIGPDSRLQLSVFVTQLLAGLPNDDGAPAYYFPLDGDRLPLAFDAFDRAIVYVWREDCPPCDLMREDLGAVAPECEGIALFSVYGPDWQEFLAGHYDVIGAPTTLFVVDGTIDARLTGAHYPAVIREEIEKTRRRD